MNGDIVYSVNLDFLKKNYLKNKKKGWAGLSWVGYPMDFCWVEKVFHFIKLKPNMSDGFRYSR